MGNQITRAAGASHDLLATSTELAQDTRITADQTPQAGFIDMTAQLDTLSICLPDQQRFEVRSGSEALPRLRHALEVLTEAAPQAGQPAPLPILRERAQALLVLLQMNVLDQYMGKGLMLHGEVVGLTMTPQTPCWLATTFAQLNSHAAELSALEADTGASPAACDPPPLHLAALSGKTARIKHYLAEGANPMARDAQGRTALDVAVQTGKLGVVNALLEVWGDLNVSGYRNTTPLGLAARFGQLDIMRVLVEAGADVNVGGADTTAIHEAIVSGVPKAVTLLHTLKADPQLTADYARYQPEGSELKPGESQLTPMELAFLTDQPKMVSALQRAGADLSAPLPAGRLLLNLACAVGNLHLVNILLAKEVGADVRAQDAKGRNALMWAAAHGQLETAERLIKSGARCDATDESQHTALHLACHGATEENEAGKLAVVTLLCSRPDTTIDARNKHGETALHMACQGSSGDLVACLLKAKANPTLRDARGLTALHHAAADDNLIAVHDLLANRTTRVDPNAADNAGITALQLAARAGYVDVAEELLKKGAGTKACNKNGGNALMSAVLSDKPDMVTLLLDHGATLPDRHQRNTTLLEWARQRNKWRVAARLAGNPSPREMQ